MRSVQTARSTHHQRSWASPACLAPTGRGTGAGGSSLCWFITHPLSCVPSLHGRYPLRRYYGRSDSCRAVLRASGHERCLSPAGLPDYGTGTSGHSVSNHRRVVRGSPGCQRVLPAVTGFVFRSQTRPLTPTESSSPVSVRRDLVTDWSFSPRCSPPRLTATRLRFDTARIFYRTETDSHRSIPAPSQAHERGVHAASMSYPNGASK